MSLTETMKAEQVGKLAAAGDPAVLNLTGRKVEGTTVTLRYGCKNNHSGVKINGRDVALDWQQHSTKH